jgi:hypothetical protein
MEYQHWGVFYWDLLFSLWALLLGGYFFSYVLYAAVLAVDTSFYTIHPTPSSIHIVPFRCHTLQPRTLVLEHLSLLPKPEVEILHSPSHASE